MIVVADSGPAHYLLLVDQIELLRRFYGRVVIPDAVASELSAASSPAAVSIWIAHPPEWAVVTAVPPDQIATVSAEQGVINVPEVLDKLRATSFYTDEALIDLIFGQWLRR